MVTTTFFSSRLTFAWDTPSRASRAFCTLPEQWAHIMPSTISVLVVIV